MFQYAFGKAYALTWNVPLFLDLSWFENMGGATKRKLELLNFNLQEFSTITYSPQELVKLRESNKFFRRLFKFDNKKYVSEFVVEVFKENLILLRPPVYFEGFWQTEKYFLNFFEIIKREFCYTGNLNEYAQSIKHKLETENSVSVHIRRGDYYSSPEARSVHGLDLRDYYRNAANKINEKYPNAKYYLFSDDVTYLKNEFDFPYEFTIVENNNALSPIEDLVLMSSCKHNIIANSSFSWWAAWLNSNTDKMVVAPEKWFNEPSINFSDIIPQNWIKL
jgi:hypothetical protein